MPRYAAVCIIALLALTACDSASSPSAPGSPTGLLRVFHAPSTPPTSATDSAVGRYTLQLQIGSGEGCNAVPESARVRTYTADIHAEAASAYIVKLFDGRLGRNEFEAARDGDSFTFAMQPPPEFAEFDYNIVSEQLPDGTTIEIAGHAAGTRLAGVITAQGDVRLSYWQGSPGSSELSVCTSNDFRLRFVPK